MSQSGIPHKQYSVDFKLQVVYEALTSGLSHGAICRKYSLSTKTLIRSWIRTFAPQALEPESIMNKSKDEQQQEIDRLKKLLLERELELKHQKMRADFLDEMINVAEEMFQIPVRKKAGTKQ